MPTERWTITVPSDLAAKVELLTFDPLVGRPEYGARAEIITRALQKYVEQLCQPEDGDVIETRIAVLSRGITRLLVYPGKLHIPELNVQLSPDDLRMLRQEFEIILRNMNRARQKEKALA